jgi:predicted pyridoxine 5'-phosphate oxidase superfamily flavin-nucleotide-binding protein
MELTTEIRDYLNRSVLYWLATVSSDSMPNVSPKEIFTIHGPDKIMVANIASPQTVKNIEQNTSVCISFLDILVQKAFQVKGTATIVGKTDPEFSEMAKLLEEMTGGYFPFATITGITAEQVKPILAPKHLLYPDTTEEEQISTYF